MTAGLSGFQSGQGDVFGARETSENLELARWERNCLCGSAAQGPKPLLQAGLLGAPVQPHGHLEDAKWGREPSKPRAGVHEAVFTAGSPLPAPRPGCPRRRGPQPLAPLGRVGGGLAHEDHGLLPVPLGPCSKWRLLWHRPKFKTGSPWASHLTSSSLHFHINQMGIIIVSAP